RGPSGCWGCFWLGVDGTGGRFSWHSNFSHLLTYYKSQSQNCQAKLKPEDRPAAAHLVANLHITEFAPTDVAIGEKNVAAFRLRVVVEVARGVVGHNSTGAADLGKAAGIFLNHNVGKEWDRRSVCHAEFRLKVGIRRTRI